MMNSTILMFTLLISFLCMAVVLVIYLKYSKRKKNVNKNGRIYSEDVLADAIKRFEYANQNVTFVGEMRHPESVEELTVKPIMTIQSVECNKKRRFRIFKRNRTNKDVKRVMDALQSPDTIIAYTGSIYGDNISFTCNINKDNE